MNDAFSRYLDQRNFTAAQIQFVKQILNYFIEKGRFNKGELWERPFTDMHSQGPHGLFKEQEILGLVQVIDDINGKAVGI